jgi:ferrochelatase
MRYGNPPLKAGLEELRAQGCSSVLVVPLFPQYSNTTTGSIMAEVARITLSDRYAMRTAFVASCFDDEEYIDALARVAEESPAGDFTVFSFHGIPESYVQAGDPYLEQCGRTAWLLAQRLGLARDEWEMVFQSQFGDEPWLQPYLDEYVCSLAGKYARVRVIAPSFAADCLETLEEIGVSLREDFELRGGQELIVVPALNSHPAWVQALGNMIRKEIRS